MRTLTLISILSLAAGCTDASPAPATATTGLKTIQMDDSTLYVDGDNWLFSFPAEGKPCVIVASGVAFIERWSEHLVVNLDLTETEKADGKTIESPTLLQVPTTGEHQVLVVYPGGITECSVAVPPKLNPKAFIHAVLAHPDVAGVITDH